MTFHSRRTTEENKKSFCAMEKARNKKLKLICGVTINIFLLYE